MLLMLLAYYPGSFLEVFVGNASFVKLDIFFHFNMEVVSSDSDSEICGKRRKMSDKWKKNLAKWNRNAGEEYTTYTGQIHPGRKTGPNCKCKRKCCDLYTEEEKSAILSKFNGLATKNKQDVHLCGLMSPKYGNGSLSSNISCFWKIQVHKSLLSHERP